MLSKGSFTATSISALMHAFHQLRALGMTLSITYIVLTEAFPRAYSRKSNCPWNRNERQTAISWRQDPGYVAHQ